MNNAAWNGVGQSGSGGAGTVRCATCRKEIFPAGCLPGAGYYRSNYCECTKVQRPQVPVRAGEAERLRAIADQWFEHPSSITKHERETQYQAYKARLMLELHIDKSS